MAGQLLPITIWRPGLHFSRHWASPNHSTSMVEVDVRQGCVMSPWLFIIYMYGCIREMKVGVWDGGARLNVRGMEQPLVAGLYAGDSSVGRK